MPGRRPTGKYSAKSSSKTKHWVYYLFMVVTVCRSTGSTSSWMSSESNYAGHSVMSEGSQASFIVEV